MPADPHPQQATLDGVPPVVAPLPQPLGDPEHTPSIAVLGTLQHAAQVRTTQHNQVRVEVLLQQHIEHHPPAAPLFAALAMADLGSVASRFDAARTIAQHLPAGTMAIVTGQGLEPGHQAGQPVLRVIRTNSIKPLGQQLVDESRAGALQPDPAPAPIRQGADHAH